MSLLNWGSGLFSALTGLHAALTGNSAADPWRYVIGGSLCALIGAGNWFQLSIATWGTVLFIATSIYDGWFGAGGKDWRYYTLTAYIMVQGLLVVWSTQFRSLLSFP
jgi:hypothetical protein